MGNKAKKKHKKKEKRGLEPNRLESYCCCKQYITQAPINPLTHPKKKQTSKSKKKRKQGREGSNPLIWRPTAMNSTLLILIALLYSTCGTAVKRYIITAAAAIRT